MKEKNIIPVGVQTHLKELIQGQKIHVNISEAIIEMISSFQLPYYGEFMQFINFHQAKIFLLEIRGKLFRPRACGQGAVEAREGGSTLVTEAGPVTRVARRARRAYESEHGIGVARLGQAQQGAHGEGEAVGQVRNRAEVEHAQASVRRHAEIPGMRIGVYFFQMMNLITIKIPQGLS